MRAGLLADAVRCTYIRDVDYAGSCSCDVFIRPGQLRVLLDNYLYTCIFLTPQNKPNPQKIGRYRRFGPILGPVFLQVDYFSGRGEKKQANPNHNWVFIANSKHRDD